jgi:hypothetical protein
MRREDWAPRFLAVLQAYEPLHIAWGLHDCTHWARDVAVAMTGREIPLSRYTYADQRTAYKAVLREGFCSFGGLLGDRLERAGWRAVPPAFAPVGSIGVADFACVVRARRGWVTRKAAGGYALTANTTHAWSI